MGLHETLKTMIRTENRFLFAALWCFNHLPFNNRFRLHGNRLNCRGALLRGTRITVTGKNNRITIGKGSRLFGCKLLITGDNNTIELGEFDSCISLDLFTEDNGNRIQCGRHINFAGAIHIASIEGCTISIGDDCLFSSQVVIRNGDSHSVLDSDGNRINPSKDVVIGDHVWVGYRALLNKGVRIPPNSIVGTGAVVTKPFTEPNVAIAGNPARIVKENVTWQNERI
ncbi:MAG: acyltransferase [Clostridia bacterium]|jgi:acetyltransferase-like isoleucine patch superfamily enzyme|nr:acyltransferase [Clostridia bacterium]